MIKVVIDSLRHSILDAEARFALLKEEGAERFIPVGLSHCEFRQLALRLRYPESKRVQTYTFFAQLIRQTNLSVRKVYIHSHLEHTYKAQVLGAIPGVGVGRAFAIDCRASDALLTAVHFQVPIFVSEPLLVQGTLSWDEFVSAERIRVPNPAPEPFGEGTES